MKVNVNDVDNYSQAKTGFFKLENDKDVAKVRFMYNTIDDVNLDVVHEIEIGDKKRLVSCLRSYDEPVDNCPLCRECYKPQVKLFVPVYNIDADEVQFWQRGKSFISQLSGLFSRYNPLVGTAIEIERCGKKGDQTTKYMLYPSNSDDTTLDDLPDVPDSMNSFVLNKSYDELTRYVETGSFDVIEKREERSVNSGRTRPQF